MALPANWAKCYVIYGSDQKNPFVNVLWFLSAAPPMDPSTAVVALAAAVDAGCEDAFKQWLPSEALYIGVQAEMSISGAVYTAGTSANQGAGTLTGDQLPDYAAARIQKRTTAPGKSGRGRWFIGCVAESQTNTSRLVTTGVTKLVAIADGFTATYSAGGTSWVAAHHSTLLATLTEITGTTVPTILATQRRRRLRQFA